MTSVCIRSLVYADSGLLARRPATTHGARSSCSASSARWVDADARFVDEDVITTAGVSAGIGMELHLVARLLSRERAVEVGPYIQYDPEPLV